MWGQWKCTLWQIDADQSGKILACYPARMKILVAYYSNTGNTKSVAEAIAKGCSGDVETIIDLRQRKGAWGYLLAGMDSLLGRPTQIKQPVSSPASYDLVVLGTPVWSWKMTPAMRSYLKQQSDKLPRVAFFCTEGGAGDQRVFQQMADLCGQQPEATLVVKETEIKSGTHSGKIAAFVSALQLLRVPPDAVEGTSTI